MKTQRAKLILENKMSFNGFSFGQKKSTAGEVVFNTGMTGYPESFTDPSYYGQILTMTYPLIGNYGVPDFSKRNEPDSDFESQKIQIKGLIVSENATNYSHWKATQSLSEWLSEQNIPAICNIDTRSLTKVLRENGTMSGKIVIEEDINFFDPNNQNLMNDVSIKKPEIYGQGKKRIALFDCGCKSSIIKNFTRRNIEVLRLPWNSDITKKNFDAVFISNGPGNPKMCQETIKSAKYCLDNNIPTMGICLGHQILSLAAGADTYKLKYGHRSQNQPVMDIRSKRCFITSQNHGFAVDADNLPDGWSPWYINLNDHTNEGIIHESGRFMSVQFHPEATPGPVDTVFIFDRFIDLI